MPNKLQAVERVLARSRITDEAEREHAMFFFEEGVNWAAEVCQWIGDATTNDVTRAAMQRAIERMRTIGTH